MEGKMRNALSFLLLSCIITQLDAYSMGAPLETCGNMIPIHGAQPQSSPPPYTIRPGVAQVEGGKQIEIILEASSTPFMGFLVQAQSADNGEVAGTFFTSDHKYLNCNNGMNNAVTHANANQKQKVTLTWEAPSDFSGDVIFKATFVQEKVTFWVGVTSEKVTVTKSASAASTNAPETPSPSAATTTPLTTDVRPSPAVIAPGDSVINVVSAPSAVAENAIPVASVDVDSINSPLAQSNPPPPSVTPPSPTIVSPPDLSTSPTDSESPSTFNSESPSTINSESPSLSDSESPSLSTSDSESPSLSTSSVVESPSLSSSPAAESPSLSPSRVDSPSLNDATESTDETETPEPAPSTTKRPKSGGGGGRRKFGLFNRRKTTIAPAPSTTTAEPAGPTEAAETTTEFRADENLSPEFQQLQQNMVNIYDACAIGKGCFGIPTGCEAKRDCKMLMSYTAVSGGYQFELMGKVGNSRSSYYATGLSDDEKMGGDSVMACRLNDGQVDVVMAQNIGKENQLLTDPTLGLSQIRTAQIDGKVYCTFVRQTSTEILDTVWDLKNNRYHIMVATGPLNGGILSYHSDREVSSGTVSLSQFKAIAATGKLFQILHSALMVGAWICAASCGIMIARYYKKTWLEARCCGIDQWFHLHRFFMGLTWGMTVAGVVLIFYHVGGWTEIQPQDNPHAIIGIISVGLCFIQPFMALCRCSPDNKNRSIFNWLHWMVGNAAQILGITAIFFGLELVGAPEWTTFILIIFIAFHCLVHLILSIGQCVSDSKAENGNNIYPMKETNGSRTPLNPSNKRLDAPGAGFRKTMLAFYMLINFLITAVLLLIVVVEEEQLKKWGLIFWEK